MPPRHAYWTIIFGNQPTSFRAATAEELLPTLKQIQAKHPDAVMKWFAHGRLWDSQEAQRAATRRKPTGFRHRGPAAPWQARQPQEERPRGPKPEWRDRPQGERPRGPKPEWRDRSQGERPRGPKPEWRDRPQGERARGPKPEWRDRPQGERPRGPKPEWRDRPQGERTRGPKPEWRDRPQGERTREPKQRWRDRGPASGSPTPRSGEGARGRDWRPGGEHRDPRDRFKVPRDVKRKRFADRLRRDRFSPKPPRKKKDEE